MSIYSDANRDASDFEELVNENTEVTTRLGPNPKKSFLRKQQENDAEFQASLTGYQAQVDSELEIVKDSRGFRVVGTFASGFTYELPNDVGEDASGNYWIYSNADGLPFTVPPGTTPSSPTYTQVTFNDLQGIVNLDEVSDLNLTVAREVDLATAVVDDAPVGTRYSITDRDGAPMIVQPVGLVANTYTRVGLPSGRTLELNTNKSINVKWAGATGDGATDDRPAIEAAYSFRALRPSLTFTKGSYAVSDGLNLGSVNGSEIIFNSGAELVGTGVGAVVSFDGSSEPGGVYGCRIINPRVRSSGTCQTGFLLRAFQHFYMENPEARDVVNTGMLMQWCIEGTVVNYGCSSNRGAFNTTPVSGLIMEERNAGEYCAGVKFTSIAIEGISGYGIVINDGCRTNEIQGTSEGNALGGVLINSGQNNVFSLFCEANLEADIRLKSGAWGNKFKNGIYNSSSQSLSNIELEGATNNIFENSFIRSVNSSVLGARNIFVACSVPDGSQGFLGVGDSYNIKTGCFRVDINGFPVAQVTDSLGDLGTFLPVVKGSSAAGSVTYNSRLAEFSINGNVCHMSVDIRLTSKGGATGNIQITGAPYGNNSSLQAWTQLSFWSGININDLRTQLSVAMEANSSTMQIYECGDNIGPALVNLDNIDDNAEFRFSIQYPISYG